MARAGEDPDHSGENKCPELLFLPMTLPAVTVIPVAHDIPESLQDLGYIHSPSSKVHSILGCSRSYLSAFICY